MSSKCPFCGVGLLTERVSGDSVFWQARCGICSARGPRSASEYDAIAAFTQPAHALRAALARAECAEVERLRKAAANVAAMYQTDPLTTVDGLTDTDFIMRISALRAALAAQGGGT